MEKTFASLLFSSLLCVPRGGGGVVVVVVVRSLTEEKEDDTKYTKEEEDEFWRHAPGEKGRFINLFVDDDSFFSSRVFVSSSPFLSFFL